MKQIIKQIEKAGVSRIFAYSRKSRDIDEEGLKKHHDIIKNMASKLGFKDVTFYEEVDSSETLNREQLNKLRQDIQSGKVKCLIVYRLDRLSRKVTDTERLLKEFNFNELILIEAHREKVIDYKEILGLKLEAMMSDLYQEQAKMVLTAGRQKSVALYGNHLGETPLGYDYDKETKKLTPNSDAHIIKEIYRLYLKGYSTHKIALKINQQGFRTKNGNTFKAKGIWTILQNDKYVGTQTYGKKEWYKDGQGKLSVKDRSPEDWLQYKDAHEPIITEDDFNKVQAKLKANRTVPKGKRTTTHTLSGLVKCGKCGWYHTMNKRKYKSKTVIDVRGCIRKDYTTGKLCGNKGTKEAKVEQYLIKVLWDEIRPLVLKTKRELAKGKNYLIENMDDGDLKALKREEKQLTKQLDNLIEMQMEMGKSERLMVKMKQVESRLKTVKEQINNNNETEIDEQFAWVQHFLKDSEELISFPLNWKSKSDEEKNVFLKKYFKSAILLNGEITGHEYSEEIQQLIDLLPTEPVEVKHKNNVSQFKSS